MRRDLTKDFVIGLLIVGIIFGSYSLWTANGRSLEKSKNAAMFEACLQKELGARGVADCDDPRFQVRTVNPNGLKVVMYVDEERNDLRFISNEVLFGWPKQSDSAPNFIGRHVAPPDLPLTGPLEGTGEMRIIIEHPDVSGDGPFKYDDQLVITEQAPELLYDGVLGQYN